MVYAELEIVDSGISPLDPSYNFYMMGGGGVKSATFVLDFRPLSPDRQHLSYDVCLEIRREITRTNNNNNIRLLKIDKPQLKHSNAKS